MMLLFLINDGFDELAVAAGENEPLLLLLAPGQLPGVARAVPEPRGKVHFDPARHQVVEPTDPTFIRLPRAGRLSDLVQIPQAHRCTFQTLVPVCDLHDHPGGRQGVADRLVKLKRARGIDHELDLVVVLEDEPALRGRVVFRGEPQGQRLLARVEVLEPSGWIGLDLAQLTTISVEDYGLQSGQGRRGGLSFLEYLALDDATDDAATCPAAGS